MRRFIERNVEDKIANLIVDNYTKTFVGIHLSISDDDIVVDAI